MGQKNNMHFFADEPSDEEWCGAKYLFLTISVKVIRGVMYRVAVVDVN
jgi:hypothetical protein